MKLKLTFSLLGLCLLAACQNNQRSEVTAQTDTNIRGGTEVSAKDPLARQVFRLVIGHSRFKKKMEDGTERDALKSSSCTASALTNRILITAAHCFPESVEKAHLQVWNYDGTVTNIPVIQFKNHPLYKTDPNTDLAMFLLQLSLPEDAQLLTLPGKDQDLKISRLTAAGYGSLGTLADPSGSGVLRTVPLDVVSYDPLDESIVVDQTQGRGACKGDSGSSAIVQRDGVNIVAGIMSQGLFKVGKDVDPNTVEKCSFQGRYVNVQTQLDWINSMLKHWANE
jgi:hypothetical protein